MNKKQLELSADGVSIHGKYYTVSNGFLSETEGTLQLPYRDLLSVELVKRRSKKAMFAVLLLGCVLIFILSSVRANIEDSARDVLEITDAKDAYNTAKDAYETVLEVREQGYSALVSEKMKAAITVVIVLTALASISGAAYLFTGRNFVELTTMRGTYRIKVERGDNEIKSVISQLQGRL
jgi:hypothetical protein